MTEATKNTKRVAVLTSGGNAPGMNAAIRAVIRNSLEKRREVLGIHRSYAGLLNGEFMPLNARDVGGMIHRARTILGNA